MQYKYVVNYVQLMTITRCHCHMHTVHTCKVARRYKHQLGKFKEGRSRCHLVGM